MDNQSTESDEVSVEAANYFGSAGESRSWFNVHEREEGLCGEGLCGVGGLLDEDNCE